MSSIPRTAGSSASNSSTGFVSAAPTRSSIIFGVTSVQSTSVSLSMSSSHSPAGPSQSNTSKVSTTLVAPVYSIKLQPTVSHRMSTPPSTPTKAPNGGDTTPTTPSITKPSTTTTTTAPSTTSISTKTSSSTSGPSTTSPSSSAQQITDNIPPITTTQTSTINPTTSTRTSTITDHPVSTFSSPVAVSVVNPNNGRVSLTTPAVVTVLSTSTAPNGEFVTFTHVVANPTGSSQGSGSSGFLGNQRAVAGVFVVVGIVACAVGCFLLFIFRRRRRQNRRRRWLAGMQPMSSNPFEDPPGSPQMRDINNRPDVNWDGSAPFAFGDDTRRVSLHSSRSHQRSDSAPLAGIGSGMGPRRVPVPTDHFLNNHEANRGLGFGVGYGRAFNDNHRDRASVALSSPSIYPASLLPSGDDDSTDATQSPTVENFSDSPPRNVVMGAPPRPPRSHLRRSVKPFEMYPITPPTSASSDAPSKPPSPILEQAKLVNRRTLLDVRPRSGHDLVAQGFE